MWIIYIGFISECQVDYICKTFFLSHPLGGMSRRRSCLVQMSSVLVWWWRPKVWNSRRSVGIHSTIVDRLPAVSGGRGGLQLVWVLLMTSVTSESSTFPSSEWVPELLLLAPRESPLPSDPLLVSWLLLPLSEQKKKFSLAAVQICARHVNVYVDLE